MAAGAKPLAYPVFVVKQTCQRALYPKTTAKEIVSFFPSYLRFVEILSRFNWVGGSSQGTSAYEGWFEAKDFALQLTIYRGREDTLLVGGGMHLRIFSAVRKREAVLEHFERLYGEALIEAQPARTPDEKYLARLMAVDQTARKVSKVSMHESVAQAILSNKKQPDLVDYDIVPEIYEFTSMAKSPEEESAKLAAKLEGQSLAVRVAGGYSILRAMRTKDMSAIERQAVFDGFFELLEHFTSH